jgi:hypothetical protein
MRTAVSAAFLLLLAPAPALAQTVPDIAAGPGIFGAAEVGAELSAVAKWTGSPEPRVAWAWLRCSNPSGGCKAIEGAVTDRYRVAEADLGLVLRVRLRLTNSVGFAEERSKPTPIVTLPPDPEPTSTATPDPDPTATPEPTATPDPEPTATPDLEPTAPAFASPMAPVVPSVAAQAPPSPPATKRMTPFPVVHIKGWLLRRGVRVTLLSVRAPGSARIAVSCRGRDCPTRRFTSAGTKRLRRFERSLRAGTSLEVRGTRSGYIGKYTRFVIRRGAEPRRIDRCLDPGATRPVTCASD